MVELPSAPSNMRPTPLMHVVMEQADRITVMSRMMLLPSGMAQRMGKLRKTWLKAALPLFPQTYGAGAQDRVISLTFTTRMILRTLAGSGSIL